MFAATLKLVYKLPKIYLHRSKEQSSSYRLVYNSTIFINYPGFPLRFNVTSSSALYSTIQFEFTMAAGPSRGLREDEICSILEEEYVCSSDSEIESDSSGASEVDDIAVAEAIENYCSDEEERNAGFRWESMENYVGQKETFCGVCGPQGGAQNMTDIVECFELFFSKDLVRLIVQETNRYAEQYKNSKGNLFSFRSSVRSWRPVTENEIYVILGLFMLTGIVQKPTTRLYFTKRRVVATPGFGDVISRDRFELICRFLHFCNNECKDTYQGPPKLFKIFPVLSHLNMKFQQFYLPGQNIAIDESLTLWKGRLSFRQFLPLKSSKFGIKTFELCESSSGYLWRFIVYTGKDSEIQSTFISPDTPKTSAIVMKLIDPLLEKGYTVWMDNYYNSPTLASFLKTHKTDCVGTLRLNRKNVPEQVKMKKLKKGETVCQHSGPVTVLKWCDKKVVSMISTYHNDEKRIVTIRGKEVEKPVSVLDYNKHMGGIDLKDQMLQMYLIERKRMHKWYHKLFKRLLNAAVLNSLILYRKNCRKPVEHLSFRVLLIGKKKSKEKLKE